MDDYTESILEEISPESFFDSDNVLIEAENRLYRYAIDSVDLGVFLYYEPIDHIEANETWYTITGTERGKGIQSFINRVDEVFRESILALLCHSTESRQNNLDFWYQNPVTGLRWLSLSGQITTDGGLPAKPMHFVGVLCDRTESKEAERKLEERENLQHLVMENLPVGMIVIDSETSHIETVNKIASELFGIPAELMTGKRCHHFICSAPEGFCPICDLDETVENEEQSILRRDGKLVSVLKSVILFEIGKRKKMLECFIDITSRKKIEEALRSVTDRLMLATRAGGVGIWDYDIRNETEEWDDQMYRLYSATREEFPSGEKAWQARIHPDDRVFQNREINRTINGEKDYVSEFRIIWPDGSIHIIKALAILQLDYSGKPSHLVGTNWDITAQKQTENELIRTNLHLEEAGIRANELMIQAESANVAKSAFLATISHEIRTPMNGVIGMAGLLLDTTLDDDQRQYVTLLKSSGESLLALINDVLDFSKIEARKLELENKAFDLGYVLDDTIALMSVQAHEKNLVIVLQTSEDIPRMLCGDPGRLRQILVNLIGNAIKFTDQGGITVRTEITEDCEESVLLRFSIIDTGIGISREKQKKLFTPFTQLDNSSTRKYGGTGLGLAISRQLAELMDGEIGVVSEETKGSTFWFTARFGKQQINTCGIKQPEATNIDKPGNRRKQAVIFSNQKNPLTEKKSARILLAEDNATNQLIASKLLEKIGYHVDAVATGTEAVDAVRKVSYDLVFMDCQMPGMDGYEATRQIRIQENEKPESYGKRLTIIALTAHALQGDREKCIDAGMDDYLVKPIDPEMLRKMLNHWLPEDFASESKEATPNPEIIFDQKTFETRTMNDKVLAIAVITAFLEDMPIQISRLEKSMNDGNFVQAEQLAHRIRGAAANLSCIDLCSKAGKMETAIKNGDKTNMQRGLPEIQASFNEAAKKLGGFV